MVSSWVWRASTSPCSSRHCVWDCCRACKQPTWQMPHLRTSRTHASSSLPNVTSPHQSHKIDELILPNGCGLISLDWFSTIYNQEGWLGTIPAGSGGCSQPVASSTQTLQGLQATYTATFSRETMTPWQMHTSGSRAGTNILAASYEIHKGWLSQVICHDKSCTPAGRRGDAFCA